MKIEAKREKAPELGLIQGKETKITMQYQLLRLGGGEGGIRTHEAVSRPHAFQACALSRSATSPCAAPGPGPKPRPPPKGGPLALGARRVSDND